jgi:hypothetical protein
MSHNLKRHGPLNGQHRTCAPAHRSFCSLHLLLEISLLQQSLFPRAHSLCMYAYLPAAGDSVWALVDSASTPRMQLCSSES